MTFSRRHFLSSFSALLLSTTATHLLAQSALAQNAPKPQSSPPPTPVFSYDTVVKRARDLSTVPHDDKIAPLPEALSKLSYDAHREIRFKTEKALLDSAGSNYRMQMMHPGYLHKRTVVVNVVRDGMAIPTPYSPQLYDYGSNKFEKPLPVNLGFSGFRVHYPLNKPKVFDELIIFLDASYFRFLGRDQKHGLSARGLAIDSGEKDEEFPFFKEFWIEQPVAGADRVVIHALMDSPSLTGAFQFLVYPERETVVDVTATFFMRKAVRKFGVAPLTSMFFVGENDRRFFDDFRPELHDSDGLLVHSDSGEWIWRPLRNPKAQAISAFIEKNIRGFGLMQRDRIFEHYQDLELGYEQRPSYWIEPLENWGEGHIELIELPTTNETNDNIVAFWVPKHIPEIGQPIVMRYKITSLNDGVDLHAGGRAINSYQTTPKALGSNEAVEPNSRRFIVDFAGGDLSYYHTDKEADKDLVSIVPTISNGKILRTSLDYNRKTKGFRASIDILVPPNQTADVRVFLKSGSRALTETWTFPWSAQ